ncbi:Metallo-dependent phosphatase-like protein, partial [Phellopilus nigrolimitatus]
RVVCNSDTHSHQDEIPPLPEGDILIHAGDLSGHGTEEEVDAALAWLQAQSHPHKIFIGGNHDLCLTDPKVQARFVAKYPGLTYLQDSTASVTVRGRTLRIYGNAQTPEHAGGASAFAVPYIAPKNAAAGAERVWKNVPQDVDVLVTHGPPAHHLDEGYGCAGLLHTVWRVRPRLHVFGHIHTSRGTEHVRWTEAQRAFERI